MSSTESQVDHHYGAADICARIFAALEGVGTDIQQLTREDLTPFDQFHGGGIVSTRDLIDFAGIRSGMKVLDVGCGIGGPARTLAAECGCQVTGVDLTHEFIRAAQMLTEKLGMSSRCSFEQGSATKLPAPDDTYDAVWSQNMMMNVADKAAFFAEVARVPKPGGAFAFEVVLTGDGQAVFLPTFWASSAAINFLVTRDELQRSLDDAGLELVALDDTTDRVIESSRKRNTAVAAQESNQLNLGVIVPDDVQIKMQNALSNIEEGRTITVKGVYRRPS